MDATALFLDHPWLGPLLWALLHSADYGLTILGAAVRRGRASEVVDVGGSYELNPLFQKPVDRLRWFSPRFLVSLVGLAALLYVAALLARPAEAEEALAFLLGVVVFTRAAVIGRHLQNIWLFGRMARRPGAVTGRIAYGRRTVYLLSASLSAQTAALLGVAAAVAPSMWTVGGAAGNLLLAAMAAALALRAPAERAAPAT